MTSASVHSANENPGTFDPINVGYNATFTPGKLSIGLVVPIETYPNSAVPTLEQHIERVQLAESLGFSAVWLRDVIFNVPSFGDAGQTLDPFVYLGALATQTSKIALGVASIILPLRHPAHVAKSAASADNLSGGRLIMGIASGDRPEEYPALNSNFSDRGSRFRDSYDYIRQVGASNAEFSNAFGQVESGLDLLPKPDGTRLPLMITGSSQQSDDWIGANGDGWITYPRHAQLQSQLIDRYRKNNVRNGETRKPVMEPLYIDLLEDPGASAVPIHLGVRTGIHHLRKYLDERQSIGVNHVALNLRFNRAPIDATLTTLANELIPTTAH
ncbi:LLM class oxidoreductase [Congregibacter brevis]|uniref:LLM class oxidoreductase n=1 Tax=Congregibacter brevis TaxID=3081201 RepID=A0ABZ0IGG0_9GAMM|nr:LLM class oxidoreductase [Congregibacter sp. IMCC45268]